MFDNKCGERNCIPRYKVRFATRSSRQLFKSGRRLELSRENRRVAVTVERHTRRCVVVDERHVFHVCGATIFSIFSRWAIRNRLHCYAGQKIFENE